MKQFDFLSKSPLAVAILVAALFRITSAQAQCFDNFEPNNKFGQADLINSNTQVQAAINPAADKDYYKVHITPDEPNLRVILYNMSLNYDILLYDKQQIKVGGSKHKNQKPDTIILNNAIQGTYFIKIFQKDNLFDASNCYSLSTDISATPFRFSSPGNQSGELTSLKIFPNPASQYLNIEFDEELSSEATLGVFDLTGRKVMEATVTSESNTAQLDISSLNSGIYFLRIEAGGTVVMKKFSVEKS